MTDEELELLFGGMPRPPFGLDIPTRTASFRLYLHKVTQPVWEAAIARIVSALESRDLTTDERFSIATSHLLMLQTQLSYCGSVAQSPGDTIAVDAELEVMDDPNSAIYLEIASRTTDLLYPSGVLNVTDREAIRDAFATVFCRAILEYGTLPRLITFS